MNVETEKLLQDYLDGRLTEERRVEFEARLRGDETLSRQVAAAREVRRALGGETPELSPGFYARTRARFEEQARAERRRWFRPLSWESAGLAAAAGLVLLLVAPVLLRNEIELPSSATAPLAESKSTGKRADADQQPGNERAQAKADDIGVLGLADAPGTDASASLAEDFEQGQSGAFDKDVDRLETRAPAVAEKRPIVAGAGEKNNAETAAPPLPGEQAAEAAEPTPAGDERQRSADGYRAKALKQSTEPEAEPLPEPSPKAPAPAQAAPEVLREVEADELSKKLEEPVDLDSALNRDSISAQGRSNFSAPARFEEGAYVGLGGAGLPPGVVAPGVIRVVQGREEWDRLIAGPAGAAIGSLGARYGEQRVVLIGRRDAPLDCSRIATRSSDEGYRIELPTDSEPGATANAGCAILVPWDGKRVFLSGAEP